MDKYRITQRNSDFTVTFDAGPTIGVYRTRDEAKQIIEIREHEDLILETARRLVKRAVNDLMRTHHIDRRTESRLDQGDGGIGPHQPCRQWKGNSAKSSIPDSSPDP